MKPFGDAKSQTGCESRGRENDSRSECLAPLAPLGRGAGGGLMKTSEARKVKAMRVTRLFPLRPQRLCGTNSVPRRGAEFAEEYPFDRLLVGTRSLVMTAAEIGPCYAGCFLKLAFGSPPVQAIRRMSHTKALRHKGKQLPLMQAFVPSCLCVRNI